MENKEKDQREIEPGVVVLSVEFICAMVAYGDRKFAKEDSERQKEAAK